MASVNRIFRDVLLMACGVLFVGALSGFVMGLIEPAMSTKSLTGCLQLSDEVLLLGCSSLFVLATLTVQSGWSAIYSRNAARLLRVVSLGIVTAALLYLVIAPYKGAPFERNGKYFITKGGMRSGLKDIECNVAEYRSVSFDNFRRSALLCFIGLAATVMVLTGVTLIKNNKDLSEAPSSSSMQT
jgi:hypothetical protein